MDTKICPTCKIEKPLTTEFFGKDSHTVSGFRWKCKECQKLEREAKKEYMANYREQHKEESKEYNKEYGKKHWKKNKETISVKRKNHYESNKDKILEKNRERYQDNIEQERLRSHKYSISEAGKESSRRRHHARKARELNVSVNFTLNDWNEAKEHFNHCCAYCGKESKRLTQDHFIAVSRGGGYTKDNIIPACISCNSSKRDEDFYEWYKKKPFYNQQRIEKVEEFMVKNKDFHLSQSGGLLSF